MFFISFILCGYFDNLKGSISFLAPPVLLLVEEEYMEELKNIKEKLAYEIRSASKMGSDISLIDLSKTTTTDKTKTRRKSIVNLNTNENISIIVDTLCKMHIKHNNNVIDENYRKLFKFSTNTRNLGYRCFDLFSIDIYFNLNIFF